jgi:hypothetical protein
MKKSRLGQAIIFLCVTMGGASTAFPCISNVSVSQSRFDQFVLDWTNGCPVGTTISLVVYYDTNPTFSERGFSFVDASEETQIVPYVYLNTKNRIEIITTHDNAIIYTTTFNSLAVPPVLHISSPPISNVESRAVSLQWDSDVMVQPPFLFKNPKGTTYEIQLSTTASYENPIVQTMTHTNSPDTATVGCLSPETPYFARIRAISGAGIPTNFLILGSTITLPAVTPPSTYSWGGNRWGLSLSVGEITEEDQILYNETPLDSPLLSPGLPEKIMVANAKLESSGDPRRRPLPHGLVEIQTSRACPVQLDPALENLATLTYTLPSVVGEVDTGAGTIRQETISFYRLDPQAGLWNKVPSRVEGGQVTATITELGTLAVMGQEDVSLQNLRVSPNPLHLGSDTDVTFANMAEQATLRIFTASGREVRRLEETDGDGVLRWDGKNSSGESVSPGVYLYHVQSPGAEKKGKVMVLR